MAETIAADIKDFVVSNFLFGQNADHLTSSTSFLENGIIDSTGVLELVAFLEQQFNIAVADSELLPENLDSIDNASTFVARKLATQQAQVTG